jgi:lipopolysaccharide assembly outer membrane protein LptD (OstA)
MIIFEMKKGLMIGVSVLLFSILFLALKGGRENSGDLQVKSTSFIKDIKILQKKSGATLWTLTARKADFKEGGDKAELSDVNVFIEKSRVSLHADKGLYNLTERSFTTDSMVDAVSKNYKISADSIDYETSSDKIKSEGRIKLEGKGFSVEGEGMKAEGNKKVSILNNVKATFRK